MKVLVTGAGGTVGSATLNHLLAEGKHEITVFDLAGRRSRRLFRKFKDKITVVYGDISSIDQLRQACIGQDMVIHLAALIPPLADDEPELADRVNHIGTKNLISCLEESSPEAFLIYGSSISVYGDRLKNPQINVGDPLVPSVGDEYAITKIKAEEAIQASNLAYTIFRITAVMGADNHKISKLMFHMPLATPIELITPEDVGQAFANAVKSKQQLNGRIFNLSGGESCQIIYRDLLAQAFKNAGLGQLNFPEHSFALQNFHCAYYADGDELEDILHFRQDTMDDFFRMQKEAISPITKILAYVFKKVIKQGLLAKSEPLDAYKTRDKEMLDRFFGHSD